jgi:ribosomal protein L12E/L44/L45/RPP1/RPP2
MLFGTETSDIQDVLNWVEKKATGYPPPSSFCNPYYHHHHHHNKKKAAAKGEEEEEEEEEKIESPVPMPGIVVW